LLAARIHELGDPPSVVIEDLPDPEPGQEEALVRVHAALLAHLDLTVASGRFPIRPTVPYVPGTEGAGEIVSSDRFEPGQRVRIRGHGVGVERPGTWAQLVAVPEQSLTPIPAAAPYPLAAAYFSPTCTAQLAVHLKGALEAGELVGVTGGSGAVGSVAVQLAQRGGASGVIAVVSRPEKAAAVPPGADVRVGQPLEALDADEELPSLWIDMVGGPVLEQLPARTLPGGRIACVGYTAGTDVTINLPALFQREVSLLAVNLMRHGPAMADYAAEVLTELIDGRLSIPVEEHGLGDVAAAIARLRSGEVRGRIVLSP
jgi:NADPH:quinone reductase